ncbi:MAG: N-acetylmuramoyl-L-alanine amidase [Clostridia bacterium]|nr:N-acetylmuramoyl-L-alanine amidase [Clostridia bacterium]
MVLPNPSHGGFDGGAVAGDGTVEKDINLEICLSLQNMLQQNGFEVIMTRTDDTATDSNDNEKIPSRKKSDLKNRLALMNKYNDAVFVSVHLNKFTTTAAFGSQVFYSGRDEKSKQLADKIQGSIVRLLQPENTRVNKKATSSTYLLYNATVPAVLVECGFLSNSSELTKLKNPKYQRQMAFSIFCGITEFFNNNKEI